MGDEHEGPDAAPRSQQEPYADRPKPARRWSRHLSNRDLHPANRAVVTPKGIFRSASQAGDAHGYSRSHVAKLAKAGERGFRWFALGVDEWKPTKVRGAKAPRPARPDAKRVYTPEGSFASTIEAAARFGIHQGTASRRARLNLQGWSYDPPTDLEISKR